MEVWPKWMQQRRWNQMEVVARASPPECKIVQGQVLAPGATQVNAYGLSRRGLQFTSAAGAAEALNASLHKWASCDVVLCYVMLCCVMLCYVMLCYVMLCYVMLFYVMLHKNQPWRLLSTHVKHSCTNQLTRPMSGCCIKSRKFVACYPT
jgi:hypothetical protein